MTKLRSVYQGNFNRPMHGLVAADYASYASYNASNYNASSTPGYANYVSAGPTPTGQSAAALAPYVTPPPVNAGLAAPSATSPGMLLVIAGCVAVGLFFMTRK